MKCLVKLGERISRYIIDEVHYIADCAVREETRRGQKSREEFRPEYREIVQALASLRLRKPLICLTANMTPDVHRQVR